MDENEVFRQNLLRFMRERGLRAAELSKRARLNPRAVKDIEEGRAVSPKLSTVFALARALGVDACELIGLGPRHKIDEALAAFLGQYSQSEQEQLLSALAALPARRA